MIRTIVVGPTIKKKKKKKKEKKKEGSCWFEDRENYGFSFLISFQEFIIIIIYNYLGCN